MSSIKPQNPELLTDLDVDYSHFHCCGDEDLVFLRCPSCGYIWIECYECSTWYVDLRDLSRRESSYLSSVNERVACPECSVPFTDFYYLSDKVIDSYLSTRQQVIAAGFDRFLVERGDS